MSVCAVPLTQANTLSSLLLEEGEEREVKTRKKIAIEMYESSQVKSCVIWSISILGQIELKLFPLSLLWI